MSSIQQDLAIFKKFNFERLPVGVKFLPNKPEGIEKLDKILGFCEMPPESSIHFTPHSYLKRQAIPLGAKYLICAAAHTKPAVQRQPRIA
jgi:hypothetical protein